MAQEPGILRGIAWQEAFPALRLFSALRLALSFRAILLAAIALALTSAGWRVDDWIFSDTTIPRLQEEINSNRVWPWEYRVESPPLDQFTSLEGWREQSPLLLAWGEISDPFSRMYEPEITFDHFVYLLAGALWTLAVWALFGGAITRLAAVTFARQENVSWKQLTRFVVPRWPAYFAAPLLPILGTFLLATLLALLGLLLRFDAGILAAGILWPLVLLVGFLMAFLLLGLFFGWPLMWGTISAEGTDSFGALSHSYSYAYQRPLKYLLYAVIAALVGVLGWYLVALFATWIIDLANWGVSWGSGAATLGDVVARNDLTTLAGAGGALIGFWQGCIAMLAAAFIFTYFWSASTVIYFLLRLQVDAKEMDEVFMTEDRQRHALPPLKTGADGVAEAADDPATSDQDSPRRKS